MGVWCVYVCCQCGVFHYECVRMCVCMFNAWHMCTHTRVSTLVGMGGGKVPKAAFKRVV